MSYLFITHMYRNFNFLDEDSHPRNKTIENIKNKENANNLVYLGDIKNNKELKDHLYKIGSPNQIRKSKRQIKNTKKLNHKNQSFAEITLYLRNMFNRPTGNFTKEERLEIHLYFERAYKAAQLEPLPYNVAAAYNPLFKAIYTNPNSIYTQFPLFKEKLLSHEIQHYIDHAYVLQKYGKSAANKLIAQAAKNQSNDDTYIQDPMEYNAMLIGANTDHSNYKDIHNNYQYITQSIMDRAVHGKSTPKITGDMINSQFPQF